MMQPNSLRNKWKQADRVERTGVLLVVGAALVVIVVFCFKKGSFALDAKHRREDIDAGPHIEVATVARSSPDQVLSLLGEARPYESVTLYAKVSGFLKDMSVDKGDHVEEGQILARIESPETSQDFAGAQADARNKAAIAERYKPLLDKKLVSQQEADQAFSDAQVAQAKAESLGAIKGYQEIRAPFSGTITARYADPGALVQNAENAQTSAQPVFTIAQINRLRVYVYVDQKYAAAVHNGLPVQISLQERPDVQVKGTVTRFSGALDDKTRMLLAEIDLNNRDGVIVPGSFVQVTMAVKSPSYLEVPVEALVVRDAKDFVPVITSSSTINYRPVTLADNDGQHVKVLTGLQAGDHVALNLGNSIDEGARVQPIVVAQNEAPHPK